MKLERRLAGLVFLASIVMPGFALPLGAQTIGTVEGKVTLGVSGEALQGASIGVVGTQVGAISRADGSYRFTMRPGTYELRVRMLGFAGKTVSFTVIAGGRVTQNFVLEKSTT